MKTSLRRLLIIIIWAIVFVTHINGQIWESTQIPGGLSSVAMVIDKNDKLYVGLIDGIWSTTDDGDNWEWVSETLVNTGVKSIAKTGNGNLLAGTSARGVFHSSNNGTSWTASNNGLSHFAVSSIIVVGNNCYIGTIRGGVYLSTNNGTSWTSINNGLTDLRITALTSDGSNVFAGTAKNGVFVSSNNGISWSQINSGLTYTIVNALISEGNNLYAGTNGGVFYSDNGGTSWSEINNGIPVFARYINALIKNGSKLFAGSYGGGVFYSTDNGTNWTAVNNGLTYPYVQTFIISGNNIFAGTRGAGVFVSSNDGANWSAINNGLTGNFVMNLFISGTDLFAGTNEGVFKSTNSGSNWSSANQGFPAFSSDFYLSSIAVNDTGHIFVSSGSFGVFHSTDNGDSWYDVSNGIFNAVHSLGINNLNGFLFAGTGIGVYRSTNNGVNWTEINQGIIIDPNWQTSIGKVAVKSNGDVFATADINYNGLYRSTNSGSSWTKIVNGLVADSTYPLVVSNISFSPNGVIYVYSHNGPDHEGIFISNNNGNSWVKRNNGIQGLVETIATNSFNHVFAAVPNIPGRGIYRSTNNGYSWNNITTGQLIGNMQINNLAVNSNDRLFAASSVVWRTVNSTTSQTFVDSLKNLNLPISNSGPTISIISINHPPPPKSFNKNINVSVASVEVSIDEILHQRTGDLTITLSHNGVTDTLVLEAGGSGKNFYSTLLSDEAEELIGNGTSPFTEFYKPFKPLSAFQGLDPYGDWELKIIDGYSGNDGTLTGWSIQISLDSPVLSTEDNDMIYPVDFVLHQNYPNPFNPSTRIKYQVSGISHVSLKIYDLLGREAATLVNEQKPAGSYEFDFNADALSSGIYFYRLQAGSFIETKKMIVLR
ncbi:MAG: T9SS type A sorting domain-containing protein [Ignavibacterium sp.]|nr:T9SS type A sorting domain-containing protein [Ignavibacterium sp.]